MPIRQRQPRDPEGKMTLGEHLRELRNRIVQAAIPIVIVTIIVGWLFYQPIFAFLTHPFCELTATTPQLHAPSSIQGGSQQCPLWFNSVVQPLILRLKVSLMVALVVTSPFWFYQIWAFITPGLKHNERKWSALFLVTSVPLFLIGAALAYLVLSKGLHILLSLIPQNYGALITIGHYFAYATAMLLIFGVGFEVPLLVVLLNLAGILTFERLKKWQRLAVVLIFAFAAIATPSADPFSMLALALPMTALFEAAVVVAYFNDKRRGRGGIEAAYEQLDDDETSPLEMDRTDM